MLRLKGSPRDYRVVYGWMMLFGLLQGLWGLAFIFRSSFVIEGRRCFCLFDDAMISMCYARNWVTGHGLVWNPGARVEGYTNLLWTLILGVCHLPRLSPSHTCLLVQLLGIAVSWLCLVSTVRLARSCRLLASDAILAVLLTATFYNALYFTLLGMETGLVTALVTLALASTCESLRAKKVAASSILWFAPVLLMRPDVLPLLMVVAGFLLVMVPRGRLRLTMLLGAVAATALLQVLWRHYYYGEWLPNTYYLKATNWPLFDRIGVGLAHTAYSAVQLGVPALLAIAVLLEFRPKHLLLCAVFAVAVAHQVYIGGDAWPLSRFLIPTVPGLCILAAVGIRRLASVFRARPARAGARVAVTLGCIACMNISQWPHLLLIRTPQMTAANRTNVQFVHAVDRIATPEATVAVGYAGVFPYFSGRICYDILGKCDPVIARLPVNPKVLRAGHNKFDLGYTIRVHQPDVLLHSLSEDRSFLDQYRPVVVESDGIPLRLVIRQASSRVHGGDPTTWQSVSEQLAGFMRD